MLERSIRDPRMLCQLLNRELIAQPAGSVLNGKETFNRFMCSQKLSLPIHRFGPRTA